MLKAAEKEVINRHGNIIELAAQVRVSDFYVKKGYSISNEIFDDEECAHIWMSKELR